MPVFANPSAAFFRTPAWRMVTATRQMQALGYEVIQSGRGYGVQGDGAFAYFSTGDRLSTLIELIQLPTERYPPDAVYPR